MAKKVLIIESDPDVAAAAEALLAAAGCETRLILRADQAPVAAQDFAPDMILFDQDRSDGDLGEFVSRIKEAAPKAHLAGLTASADGAALERARSLGVDRFVHKGPGIISFRRMLLRLAGSGGRAAGRRHRVLVVDDEESICKVLKLFLGGKGYEVETAADGAEGLKAIKYFKPEVVLLDISMPGMDGVEVLRELRRLYPGVGVIMVSANTDEERARECLRLGAADYITKPFDLESLETSLTVKLLLSS